MRLTQVGNRPTIVLGVLLAAAVAVAGQHYLDYRQALARSLQEIEALQRSGPVPITRLPAAPPQGFADYLRQQADAGRPVTAKWSVRGWRLAELGRRWPAGRGRGPGHGYSGRPGCPIATPAGLGIVRCVPGGRRWPPAEDGPPGCRRHRRPGEAGALPGSPVARAAAAPRGWNSSGKAATAAKGSWRPGSTPPSATRPCRRWMKDQG